MVGRPRSSVVSNSGRRGGGKTSARVSTASSAASRLSLLRDGENTPSVDSTFDWEEAKEKAIQSHRKKFQEVQNAALRDKKAKSERTRLMDPPPPPTNRTTRPSIPGVSDSSFDMSNAEREAIARNRQLFKEGQEKKRDRKMRLQQQQRQRSRSPSPGGDEEDDTEGEVSSTASNSPGRNRNTGKNTRDRQAGTDEGNGADMFAQLKRVLPRKRLPEGLKVIPQPPGKKRQAEAEQTSSATTKKSKTYQKEKQPEEDSPQQIESDEDQAEAVPVVQTETMVTSTPCVEGLSQPRSTLSFTPSPVANRTARKILLTGKPPEKTTTRTLSPSPGGDEEDHTEGEVSSTASNSPGRNRNTGKNTRDRQGGTDEGNGADMFPQLKRVLPRMRLPKGLKVIPQPPPPGKKRQAEAEQTSSATTKKSKTSQKEKQPEDSPQQIESDEYQAEAVPVVQIETMVTSTPCVEGLSQPRSTLSFTPSPLANRTARKILLTGKPPEKTSKRTSSPSPGGDHTDGEVSSTASNSPGRNINTGKDTRNRQAGTDEGNGADMFPQLKRVLPRMRLAKGLKVIPQPPPKKRQAEAEQTSSATTKKSKTSQKEKQPEDSPQQIESNEDQAEAVPVVQTETMVTSTPYVEALSQARNTPSFPPSPLVNRTARKILLTGKPPEKTTNRISNQSKSKKPVESEDGEGRHHSSQPPPATAGTSQSFRKSRAVGPARSTMESDENEGDAAPRQPTRSANASQVASKSLSQQSIFSVVGPSKPRPRKRPSVFDTVRSNALGETLKKPARASVVKRYVGKDKFGNYHMLKPIQFKTILDTAVPDHELNDLQRKKLELRVNHYLEDFFVNLCETTPQPRGFFSFHFLKELMINQHLLDEDATDFDLMKLMKSLCSPEAWKRGEGVLYPKRGKTGNDDYLYTD